MKYFTDSPSNPIKEDKSMTRNMVLEATELILSAIDENPEREGLKKTPQRYAKAIAELCSGYKQTAKEVAGDALFQSEGSGLVSIKDVEFYSLCEHHMLPFWGKVSIAYYPKDKIIGLSKVPRIVDVFSKRLQVQERLTKEIVDSLAELLDARAVFARMEGSHMCMMMRGVKKQSSVTLTEYSRINDLSEQEINRAWKSLE